MQAQARQCLSRKRTNHLMKLWEHPCPYKVLKPEVREKTKTNYQRTRFLFCCSEKYCQSSNTCTIMSKSALSTLSEVTPIIISSTGNQCMELKRRSSVPTTTVQFHIVILSPFFSFEHMFSILPSKLVVLKPREFQRLPRSLKDCLPCSHFAV